MKTKTLLFTALALFLLLGGMGCEKELPTETIQIKDFSYFGCKEKSSFAINEYDSDEYIEYKAEADGYLYIKHVNAVFNCCPDTITATSSIEGNNISIVESETGPKCNCICDYDLVYKLGPLSNQKYTLIFSRDDQEYLRFTIHYDSSLEGKIVVPKSDNLIGIWKLEGFGNEDTKTFKEAEPKDCKNCFVLTFYADSTFRGQSTINKLAKNTP